MGKVTFNITVPLDGFVAGPNDGPENGQGDGGERLFKWKAPFARLSKLRETKTSSCAPPPSCSSASRRG